MRILISPYSAKLPTGNRNPKNWPYFAELVEMLKYVGHDVFQIGVRGEELVAGIEEFILDLPLNRLRDLKWDTFVSVDNFWPHYCYAEKLKSGVVIFGQSDPQIFGHLQNINLLKSRDYLRPLQFQHWFDVQHDPAVFVQPGTVMNAVTDILNGRFIPQSALVRTHDGLTFVPGGLPLETHSEIAPTT